MSIRNFASEAFGTKAAEGLLTAIPRQRFNFKVEITVAGTASPIVFERIQDVQIPGYQFDTQIVNQYNKKRVVQTKLNYGPTTINFYDTFDNKFHNILRKYMKNYYNTDTGIDTPTTAEDSSSVLVDEGAFKTNMGFNPTGSRYFIDAIKITQLGMATETRVTTLKNCMITSVSGDTLSYSDSTSVIWNVTFQPESVSVTETNNTGADTSTS